MSNQELYDQSFVTTLSVEPVQLGSDLVYQSISTWDSVGHMELIASLEDAFDIMMDTDDIIDFNSYDKGKQILSSNYNIEF